LSQRPQVFGVRVSLAFRGAVEKMTRKSSKQLSHWSGSPVTLLASGQLWRKNVIFPARMSRLIVSKFLPILMKIHSSSYLFPLILVAGALASCADTATPAKVPVSTASHPGTSAATQLFQAVNAYRRSHGGPELRRHAGLDQLARKHCEYLREHHGSFSVDGKNVSHMGFEGRTLVGREIYHMSNLSENVAAANHAAGNPAAALLALMEGNKVQQKNMLDTWTDTGVGIVVDPDGTVFATQIFGTQSMSQLGVRQRFNQF